MAKNMETKEVIRRQLLEKRQALSRETCALASHSICSGLLQQAWYQDVEHICVYMAIRQEVDLTEFILQAWKDKKRIYFPRVCADTMDFYQISDLLQLEKGCFGVMEPVKEAMQYNPNTPTVMLVPGVAFSLEGNRIGYGKGYYDRYLSEYKENLYPIGIAYEMQLLEAFQTEEQDVPMTEIITEKRKVMIYDEFE